MQTVTASEFRLRVAELIGQLKPDEPVLIRRRFESVAFLTQPSFEDTVRVTQAITVRTFRERSSEYLDRVKSGEKVFLRSRTKVTAVLLPAPSTFVFMPSSTSKDTCSIAFRNLTPAQLEFVLKTLNPHLREFELRDVKLEFC